MDETNESRLFDAYDGGAKVYAAIAEILEGGGGQKRALQAGQAALRDLSPRVVEAWRGKK